MPSDLRIGAPAPNFELKDEQGETISLAQFKDKQSVVLIFYPGDMTPGCTMQLCAIRDEWQKFRDLNIAVFGVNPANAASHTAFQQRHKFPFPLLIDADKKVSEAYTALFSIFGLKIIRRTVVGIDKSGTIRYIRRGIPRNADILKAMQKES